MLWIISEDERISYNKDKNYFNFIIIYYTKRQKRWLWILSKSLFGKQISSLMLMVVKCRILKNGSSYPGKHNNSTQRTTSNCKPLEPKAQVSWLEKSVLMQRIKITIIHITYYHFIDANYLEGFYSVRAKQLRGGKECLYQEVWILHFRHWNWIAKSCPKIN